MTSILKDRVVQAGVGGLVLAVLASFVELYTVMGLPAHILIVHAPIVLIPLVALGTIALIVRPRWSEQYGPIILAFVIVTTIATVMAAGAGEQLRDHGTGGDDIKDHAEAGSNLRTMMFVYATCFVAFIGVARHAHREQKANVALRLMQLLTAVFAVLCVGSVAYTGHLGSKVVWEEKGFGNNKQSLQHNENGDDRSSSDEHSR